MKKTFTLALPLILLQATGALAVTNCTYVGSQMICSGDTTTTCRQVGGQVICW